MGVIKHLVKVKVLTAVVTKSSVFGDITLCSPLKVSRHFGGTCRLRLQGRRISQERNQREAGSKQNRAYFLILNMEATCSSETSVDFQRTTRRYISEDKNSSLIKSLVK
jgi:hypothetical protein